MSRKRGRIPYAQGSSNQSYNKLTANYPNNKQFKPKYQSQSDPIEESKSMNYEKVIARWTMVLGASTIALFLATAVSAYFLHKTDESISKQVGISRSQLRAYVSVASYSFSPYLDKDNPSKVNGAQIGMVFRNYGSTPASEFINWFSVSRYSNGTEPDFSKPVNIISEKQAIVLAPGQEGLVNAENGIVWDEFIKAFSGDGKMFMWGEASYRDAFSDSELHSVRFCLIISGDFRNMGSGSGSGQVTFKPYKASCNYSN